MRSLAFGLLQIIAYIALFVQTSFFRDKAIEAVGKILCGLELEYLKLIGKKYNGCATYMPCAAYSCMTVHVISHFESCGYLI